MFVDPDTVARRLTQAAPQWGRYREALLLAGFTRQEALELVLAAQTMVIGGLPDGEQAET